MREGAVCPEQLSRSLIWGQSKEMAQRRFTLVAGVEASRCDPHSPWQRGTTEDRKLDRQFSVTATDLSSAPGQTSSPPALPHECPRETLEWSA